MCRLTGSTFQGIAQAVMVFGCNSVKHLRLFSCVWYSILYICDTAYLHRIVEAFCKGQKCDWNKTSGWQNVVLCGYMVWVWMVVRACLHAWLLHILKHAPDVIKAIWQWGSTSIEVMQLWLWLSVGVPHYTRCQLTVGAWLAYGRRQPQSVGVGVRTDWWSGILGEWLFAPDNINTLRIEWGIRAYTVYEHEVWCISTITVSLHSCIR